MSGATQMTNSLPLAPGLGQGPCYGVRGRWPACSASKMLRAYTEVPPDRWNGAGGLSLPRKAGSALV